MNGEGIFVDLKDDLKRPGMVDVFGLYRAIYEANPAANPELKRKIDGLERWRAAQELCGKKCDDEEAEVNK